MGGKGPWLWRPPGYMGTGAPGWEVGGMAAKEVDGMKTVGGTPGLGIGGKPPGVDDEGGNGGPDKLAAGMEGPGEVKAEEQPMGTGWND